MKQLQTDFLVIGGGIAGIHFALHVANYGSVVLLSKNTLYESNSYYAQGGIAAVLNNNDSFESHINDTLIAGDGLCSVPAVQTIVQNAPGIIERLLGYGANFRLKDSKAKTDLFNLDLGLEGGHSFNRIVHADDHSGKEIASTLIKQLRQNTSIQVLERLFVLELISKTLPDGTKICYGAVAINEIDNLPLFISSKVTILCTGGAGQLYNKTSNPSVATADGIALSFRAGAEVGNLEFMQFHPTCFISPDKHCFLISEALRGFGAVIENENSKQIMNSIHPLGSLAPRDIVAREIYKEIQQGGSVYLNLQYCNLIQVAEKFPTIFAHCYKFGLDIRKSKIPVTPAAHYMCGGVMTNLHGQTSILGLYSCGETACTGVHGANRLASNSLLEALVFSIRAAQHAKEFVAQKTTPSLPNQFEFPVHKSKITASTLNKIQSIRDMVQKTMWDKVGIFRDQNSLQEAVHLLQSKIEEIENIVQIHEPSIPMYETLNIVQSAYLSAISALHRNESRGAHFRIDYPEKNDKTFNKHTVLLNNSDLNQKLNPEIYYKDY